MLHLLKSHPMRIALLVAVSALFLSGIAIAQDEPFGLRVYWRVKGGGSEQSFETFKTAKDRQDRIDELMQTYYGKDGHLRDIESKPVAYELSYDGKATGAARMTPTGVEPSGVGLLPAGPTPGGPKVTIPSLPLVIPPGLELGQGRPYNSPIPGASKSALAGTVWRQRYLSNILQVEEIIIFKPDGSFVHKRESGDARVRLWDQDAIVARNNWAVGTWTEKDGVPVIQSKYTSSPNAPLNTLRPEIQGNKLNLYPNDKGFDRLPSELAKKYLDLDAALENSSR